MTSLERPTGFTDLQGFKNLVGLGWGRKTYEGQDIQGKIAALIEEHDDLGPNHKLINSIKGIGPDPASLVLAEFYDLKDYSSAKAVAGDAGVTPAKYQSGPWVRGKVRMSRIGKSGVRAGLLWPGQPAIRWNPLVADWAERLQQRGKPFGVILVGARRKLLHLIFGVVKNNPPFASLCQRNIYQVLGWLW